jgi:hypothetical protein
MKTVEMALQVFRLLPELQDLLWFSPFSKGYAKIRLREKPTYIKTEATIRKILKLKKP